MERWSHQQNAQFEHTTTLHKIHETFPEWTEHVGRGKQQEQQEVCAKGRTSTGVMYITAPIPHLYK